MNKLMKLELRRTNIKTYIIAAVIITLCSFAMLYTFAFISMFGSDEEFFDYRGILSLTSIINMACFCVLGSVMHSRFIIDEYTGKRAILIFSYPVSRKKIFYSKFSLVTLFTIGGMLLSNILIFTIFFLTESIIPLVNDSLSINIVLYSIFISLLMSVIAGGFASIAMVVGFSRKSVQTTIVVAVLFCAAVSNFLTLASLIPVISIAVLSVIVSIITVQSLVNKINYLEI